MMARLLIVYGYYQAFGLAISIAASRCAQKSEEQDE